MQQEKWKQLESKLITIGFRRDKTHKSMSSNKWFVYENAETSISSYLRFANKPMMQVWETHFGWHHKETHEFVLEVLKNDWSRGYGWFKESNILDAPCMSMYNLADYLGWRYMGLPTEGNFDFELSRFTQVISDAGWMNWDINQLLASLLVDEKPFRWRASNSAIRVAHIAGLGRALGINSESFEQCANKHVNFIQADMFNQGNAQDWVASLRQYL